MSLLEQNTTRKGQVNENAIKLNASDNDSTKYEVEVICDIAVYARESGHLLRLYYLVFLEGYLKEENT